MFDKKIRNFFSAFYFIILVLYKRCKALKRDNDCIELCYFRALRFLEVSSEPAPLLF